MKQLMKEITNMPRLLAMSFIVAFSGNAVAQDYIKPVTGNPFYASVKEVTDSTVTYEKNKVIKTTALKDIVLIEYEEDGIVEYNKSGIKPLDLSNYSGGLYAKGTNVFIPCSGDNISQREGSKYLKKLIQESMYWNIVDCPEEAHCIMKYVFDDTGRDHAYLLITDRDGKILYKSPKVSARDLVPADAGKESAKKLFDKNLTTITGTAK